jgi:hypothetical protein
MSANRGDDDPRARAQARVRAERWSRADEAAGINGDPAGDPVGDPVGDSVREPLGPVSAETTPDDAIDTREDSVDWLSSLKLLLLVLVWPFDGLLLLPRDSSSRAS